jgi:hypothetical protein
MTYTKQQVIQTFLKVLEELNKPDVTNLSLEERKKLTENPNTPSETLAILARDKKWNVRCGVAANPNTSPETLALLAKDDTSNIRKYVAKNLNAPPETLTRLASDKNSYVRFNVSQNPNTTPEALIILAEDKVSYVRWSTETITLTKQQKEAIQNLIDSSQDENLKSIKL